MSQNSRLLTAFETHNAAEIQSILHGGFDPNSVLDGVPAIDRFIEMYFRSDRFAACLKLLVQHGAKPRDARLLPVLLNDETLLTDALARNPDFLNHRVRMPCAFASLDDVSLLHLAAEYGNLNACQWLISAGFDVNTAAGLDDNGFNGHTPIFHTVNSNANRSAAIMQLLLDAGARTDLLLKGLWWGKGFEWETLLYDVTPLSFAQCGLLPQMHRSELDIYANINRMLKSAGRPALRMANVPNRYLK